MSQNWTDEEKGQLKALYAKLGTRGIDQIAATMRRSVPSIRSTLVIMGDYVPIEKKTSPSKRGPDKKTLIAELCTITGLHHKGIEAATKDCLQELINYLKAQKKENGPF